MGNNCCSVATRPLAMGDWSATEFFKGLVPRNKLCRSLKMFFGECAGLSGLEDMLAELQYQQCFFLVNDSSDGRLTLSTTPSVKRVKTVFLAMRHKQGDMEARRECLSIMKEIFRQMMSVLYRERTRISQGFVYLDDEIAFTEIEEYFAPGCACAHFHIGVNVYQDLKYREDEWE